jgi:glycosyltransferase involved in cell wall biosynthesis
LPRWVRRPIGRVVNRADPPSTPLRGLMFPWMIEQRIAAYRIRFDAASVIVAPSRAMAELLARNGVPSEKVAIEPHGVGAVECKPVDALGRRPIRLGYVGRVTPNKGLHVICEAVGSLEHPADVELVVAGAPMSEADKEYFDHLVASADKVKITAAGYQSPSAMAGFLGGVHIVVVPSLVPEAFGFAVAEAFAAGRLVISSDAGALPELVRDGVDGFVFRRGDAAGLATKLRALVEDHELLLHMARAIRPPRSIADYVDAMERIYSKLRAAERAERTPESRCDSKA